MSDMVNQPPHYTSHPAGIECIDVAEHMPFCEGNATKYLWRSHLKSADPVIDWRKARWYLDRAIMNAQRRDYGMESVSERYPIRSEYRRPSAKDRKRAGTKAFIDPYWVSGRLVLNAGAEARRPLCAPDGDGNVRWSVPRWLRGLALKWRQSRQSFVQSRLRKPASKSCAQGRSPNGFWRWAKSGSEADRGHGGRDPNNGWDGCGASCAFWRNKVNDRAGSPPRQLEVDRIALHFASPAREAIPLIWRAGEKGDRLEDLRKARWYVDRAISFEERRRG